MNIIILTKTRAKGMTEENQLKNENIVDLFFKS